MRRMAMIALGLLLACVFFTAPVQARDISVDPTSFDYGPVEVGDSVSTTFTITGEGPGEAFVDSLPINPNLDSAYSITGMPALPIFLPEGDEAIIEVTYTPPGTGIHNATLAISSSDSAHPLTFVPLQGEGIGVSNTPVGEGVVVEPEDCLGGTVGGTPVTMTFETVTGGGNTTVCTSGTGQPPPSGFKLLPPPTYFEINTTATYSGEITVCIEYDPSQFNGPEENLTINHREGGWVDVTCDDIVPNPNTATHIICGCVTSLSPFTILYPSASSGGGAVGGTAEMVDKWALLWPWIAFTTLILVSIGIVVFRRSRILNR